MQERFYSALEALALAGAGGLLHFLQRSANTRRLVRWLIIDIMGAVLVGWAVYKLALHYEVSSAWATVYVIVASHNAARVIGIVSDKVIDKFTDEYDHHR